MLEHVCIYSGKLVAEDGNCGGFKAVGFYGHTSSVLNALEMWSKTRGNKPKTKNLSANYLHRIVLF